MGSRFKTLVQPALFDASTCRDNASLFADDAISPCFIDNRMIGI